MSDLTFSLTGEEALAELPHLYNDAGELIDYDEDQAIREESRSKIETDPLARSVLEAVLRHHHEDGGSVVEISSSLGDVGKLVGDYLGSLSDHALSTAVRERRLDAGVTVVVPLTKRAAPTAETEALAFTMTQEAFLETLPLLYDDGELAPADPPEVLERMRSRIEEDDVARPLLRFAVGELHHRHGISISELRSDLMHAAEKVGDYISGLLYDATREELLTYVHAGRLPRTVRVPATSRASAELREPVTPEQVQRRMGEMARTLRAMEDELAELLERLPEHAGYHEEVSGQYTDDQSTATAVRAHLAAWADGGPLRDAADQLEDTAEYRQQKREAAS